MNINWDEVAELAICLLIGMIIGIGLVLFIFAWISV